MKAQASSTRGKFIVFEGIDGSGKTSVLEYVVEQLRAEGVKVLRTAEPSSLPTGQLIRQILRGHQPALIPEAERAEHAERAQLARPDPASMALLFMADRSFHLAMEVEPALADGATVLCDRYVWSSLVYQSPSHPGGIARIAELNADARPADLTIWLDVHPEIAIGRIGTRGGKAELYESLPQLQRARDAYSRLYAQHAQGDGSQSRVAYVCADGELAAVRALALRVVQGYLKEEGAL